MARNESIPARFELLLCAATVAAHSSTEHPGFRQKDVRFLFDLFTNWVEACFSSGVPPVQNTQIVRYLDLLVRGGYIKRTAERMKPRYRLTRIGLIELLTRIVNAKVVHREEFFFLFYFVKNYRVRLSGLVQREGSQFPPSLRIELEALLDVRALIEREIARTEAEIRKLAARMHDADATSDLARARLKQGVPLRAIVEEAEKKYPYEFNSQKPLHELIDSIPGDQRQWEIEVGNRKRSEELWAPMRQVLRGYLAELKKLPLEN